MRKEYDAALKDYSTALTIDPRMADVYFNRGRIRLLNRDLDNAISDFDMALKQRSHLGGPAAFRSEGDSPDQIAHLTYIDRGVAWEAKGSFARARADFDSAIEIDPSAADGYMNRSRVLQKQGLLDQSLEDINKAVNLNPQSALPYLERAIVLMLEGKLKDAERDMQRSITIDSTLKSLADRRSEEAMERRSGARGAGCCEKEFGHR
jgi:tetratricopeptide (TPR) repeat protein